MQWEPLQYLLLFGLNYLPKIKVRCYTQCIKLWNMTVRTKTSGKTIALLKMRRLWLRPKRDLRSVFFVKRWLDKTLAISYRILSKKEVLELGDVCIFSNFFRKISRIFVCNIGTIPIDFYGISRDVKRTRKFLLLVMLLLWNNINQQGIIKVTMCL